MHVGFAEPYCPRGRAVVSRVASDAGLTVEDRGTLVVVNGPRFSSRAESLWHQQAGWTVVGMTGMPEAAIARELALCFTTIALVTDLDAGVDGESGVTHEEVLQVFADNVDRLKSVLEHAVAAMPASEPDATAELRLSAGARRADAPVRPADVTRAGRPGRAATRPRWLGAARRSGGATAPLAARAVAAHPRRPRRPAPSWPAPRCGSWRRRCCRSLRTLGYRSSSPPATSGWARPCRRRTSGSNGAPRPTDRPAR